MFLNFEHKGLKFEGISEGGIRTCVLMPSLNMMFDIGAQNPNRMNMQNLLLTHAHLDHSALLPYFVSQRSLRKLSGPNIYVPADIADSIRGILDLYSKLEGFAYDYTIIPVEWDQKYKLNKEHFFVARPTKHRVVSNGYTIYETKNKLKPELADKSQNELNELRSAGESITNEVHIPIVTFTGDTQIEFVLENPDVAKSKVLFLECTYIDEERPVSRARQWGHTHLFEILEHQEKFENEKIVLIHFSKRYPISYIKDVIKKRTSPEFYSRIHLFLP